jgi:hypothetical protein
MGNGGDGMPAWHSIARRMPIGFVLVLTLWLTAGCGGSEGGQQGQKQASEETIQKTIASEETDELVPVTLTKVQADRMYAGRVEGSDAYEGIAVREATNELIAYVCDGPPEGPPEAATIEAWFQGPIEKEKAVLTDDSGEQRLQVLLSPGGVIGTFTDVAGQTHDFVAEPVEVAGDAGLYWSEPAEGEGLSSRAGTIILPNGEERGKRRLSINGTNPIPAD